MAVTQSDIDKLEKAIASGVRTVRYSSGEVTYQSTAEMLKALGFMREQIAAPGEKRVPSTLAVFDRQN